jgi:hypothetical protein
MNSLRPKLEQNLGGLVLLILLAGKTVRGVVYGILGTAPLQAIMTGIVLVVVLVIETGEIRDEGRERG